MFPVLRLGPLAIQTPGLIVLIGYWLALEMTGQRAARYGLPAASVNNGALIATLAGLVGARLGYVVLHWSAYAQNMAGILALSPTTLDPTTGLTVGLAVAGTYFAAKRIPLRSLLDASAAGMATMLAAIASARFAGGSDFGIESSVPWSVTLWNAERHPVQLYESILYLAGAIWLWRLGRRPPAAPGLWFLLPVLLYGGVELALDPLHAESANLLFGLRRAQLLGLASILGAMILMRRWYLGRRT